MDEREVILRINLPCKATILSSLIRTLEAHKDFDFENARIIHDVDNDFGGVPQIAIYGPIREEE